MNTATRFQSPKKNFVVELNEQPMGTAKANIS